MFLALGTANGCKSSPRFQADATATDTAPPDSARIHFATYVALGDSINGCCGTPFPQLLLHNDDDAFPAFVGRDLATRFGLSQLQAWVSGSDSSALLPAVESLPASLAGPVLVTIVVGGNDLRSAVPDVLQGRDQADRDRMRSNIGAALDALTAPGRFGANVDVYVYESDIYDPSDGQGNWAQHCSAYAGYPVLPSDGVFAAWNDVITTEVPRHGAHSKVLSLHHSFYGHGFNASDDWISSDCIHPAPIGSSEVRRLFWDAIAVDDVAPLTDAGVDAPRVDAPSTCDPDLPGTCGIEATCCAATHACCTALQTDCCPSSTVDGGR